MCSEQEKYSRSIRDAPKKRSSTLAPISLEYLMDKEVLSSSQDGNIRDLSVLSDPSNEKSPKNIDANSLINLRALLVGWIG